MNIREKLLNIQKELVVPKSQYNSFGKYNYRNCEDILEAVKPLLEKNKCTLAISDELVLIGNRYYIKASVRLADVEDPEGVIEATAYAREEESKKGMDGSVVKHNPTKYLLSYLSAQGVYIPPDAITKDELKEQEENVDIIFE